MASPVLASSTANPRSQLEWLSLASRGWRPSGIPSAAAAAARWIGQEELARHNSRHDCWMAIRGRVYDVSSYMQAHPGGAGQLMRGAGKDATALFDAIHPWVTVDAILGCCAVGHFGSQAAVSAAAAAAPSRRAGKEAALAGTSTPSTAPEPYLGSVALPPALVQFPFEGLPAADAGASSDASRVSFEVPAERQLVTLPPSESRAEAGSAEGVIGASSRAAAGTLGALASHLVSAIAAAGWFADSTTRIASPAPSLSAAATPLIWASASNGPAPLTCDEAAAACCTFRPVAIFPVSAAVSDVGAGDRDTVGTPVAARGGCGGRSGAALPEFSAVRLALPRLQVKPAGGLVAAELVSAGPVEAASFSSSVEPPQERVRACLGIIGAGQCMLLASICASGEGAAVDTCKDSSSSTSAQSRVSVSIALQLSHPAQPGTADVLLLPLPGADNSVTSDKLACRQFLIGPLPLAAVRAYSVALLLPCCADEDASPASRASPSQLLARLVAAAAVLASRAFACSPVSRAFVAAVSSAGLPEAPRQAALLQRSCVVFRPPKVGGGEGAGAGAGSRPAASEAVAPAVYSADIFGAALASDAAALVAACTVEAVSASSSAPSSSSSATYEAVGSIACSWGQLCHAVDACPESSLSAGSTSGGAAASAGAKHVAETKSVAPSLAAPAARILALSAGAAGTASLLPLLYAAIARAWALAGGALPPDASSVQSTAAAASSSSPTSGPTSSSAAAPDSEESATGLADSDSDSCCSSDSDEGPLATAADSAIPSTASQLIVAPLPGVRPAVVLGHAEEPEPRSLSDAAASAAATDGLATCTAIAQRGSHSVPPLLNCSTPAARETLLRSLSSWPLATIIHFPSLCLTQHRSPVSKFFEGEPSGAGAGAGSSTHASSDSAEPAWAVTLAAGEEATLLALRRICADAMRGSAVEAAMPLRAVIVVPEAATVDGKSVSIGMDGFARACAAAGVSWPGLHASPAEASSIPAYGSTYPLAVVAVPSPSECVATATSTLVSADTVDAVTGAVEVAVAVAVTPGPKLFAGALRKLRAAPADQHPAVTATTGSGSSAAVAAAANSGAGRHGARVPGPLFVPPAEDQIMCLFSPGSQSQGFTAAAQQACRQAFYDEARQACL